MDMYERPIVEPVWRALRFILNPAASGGQTLEQLGSTKALRLLGERLRQTVPEYMSEAVHYTAGFKTLHQCYPTEGLGWMWHGHSQARAYASDFLFIKYGAVLARQVVDCRKLDYNRAHIPRGHLGYHPRNLSGMLSSEQSREWRLLRYVYVASSGSPVCQTSLLCLPRKRVLACITGRW